MTDKQSNRFADFTFDFLDDREVRWKKTKNGYHYHGQIIGIIIGFCMSCNDYVLNSNCP